MKLNIKGLVFVGFAAAVFASAAHATDPAPEKQVTSKQYVDNKYVAADGSLITVTPNADTGKNEINTSAEENVLESVKLAGRNAALTLDTGTKNVTIPNMTAASADAAGANGLVPAPAAGDDVKFLTGAGTWDTPTNTTYTVDNTTVQFNSSNANQIEAKTGTIANNGANLVTSGTIHNALALEQDIQIGHAATGDNGSTPSIDAGKVLVVDNDGKISMSAYALPAIPEVPDTCENANAHCALITSYNASTQVVSMEWVPTAQAPAE